VLPIGGRYCQSFLHILHLPDEDADPDVVVVPEVEVEPEVVLDPQTILRLDSAIGEAFRGGKFDNLMEIINSEPQLVDYKVLLFKQ
jgi:hypothetical protein